MSGQIPAGWYQDPYGTPGLQRYWDGELWTQATQPTDEWTEPAPEPSGGPPPPFAPPDGGPGRPAAVGHPEYAPPAAAGDPGQVGPSPEPPPPGWRPEGQPIERPAGGWSPPARPGPMTPPPWESPQPPPGPALSPGPVAQPWKSSPQDSPGAPPWHPGPGATEPARSNTGLLIALAGGGGLVAILITVVVLFATGVIGGGSDDSTPVSSGQSARQGDSAARSPIVGTVLDDQSGLSYPQLGGSWQAQDIQPDGGLNRLGFTKGQQADVMANYDRQGNSYIASITSGTLPSSIPYAGIGDLEAAAKAMFTALEPSSYPEHAKEDLESRANTVSGKSGWLYKIRLNFSQAASEGWNWRTETVGIVLVERGSGLRPAVLYISLPDSHPNLGDFDLTLSSLKAE